MCALLVLWSLKKLSEVFYSKLPVHTHNKEQEFQDCKLGYYIEIDTREKYLLSGNLIFLQHNLQKLL